MFLCCFGANATRTNSSAQLCRVRREFLSFRHRDTKLYWLFLMTFTRKTFDPTLFLDFLIYVEYIRNGEKTRENKNKRERNIFICWLGFHLRSSGLSQSTLLFWSIQYNREKKRERMREAVVDWGSCRTVHTHPQTASGFSLLFRSLSFSFPPYFTRLYTMAYVWQPMLLSFASPREWGPKSRGNIQPLALIGRSLLLWSGAPCWSAKSIFSLSFSLALTLQTL